MTTIPCVHGLGRVNSDGEDKVVGDTSCSCIPVICHESHEYTRVNFFGQCKFLQI